MRTLAETPATVFTAPAFAPSPAEARGVRRDATRLLVVSPDGVVHARFHDLADQGCCLVVSSHVMDEAERCDRLLLMRDGRLLAEGTPQALLARTGAATVEDAFLRLVEDAA